MAPESRTGSEVFLGLERGGELGWGGLTGGPEPNGDGIGQFKYIVFENPNWDWRTFDAKTDVARAENAYGGLINANDPNLKPFAFHGGKLITYHGWADTTIPSHASIAYYNVCSIRWAASRKLRIGTASSWCRESATAAVARVRTASTC